MDDYLNSTASRAERGNSTREFMILQKFPLQHSRVPHSGTLNQPYSGAPQSRCEVNQTVRGAAQRGDHKIGGGSHILISVDRLQATVRDLILKREEPHTPKKENKRSPSSAERQRHVHLGHVDLGADTSSEDRDLQGFYEEEVKRPAQAL